MAEENCNSLYYVGICDDEKSTCTLVEDMAMDVFKSLGLKSETFVWYSGESLCNYLAAGNKMDFLFLDIELARMNGVEVSQYIRNVMKDVYTQIVFISSKESYALQLFNSMPLDFLIKPICYEQIDIVIKRGLNLFDKRPLIFTCDGNGLIYRIPYRDILYFYSEGKRLNIVCIDDKVTVIRRLKDVVQELPDYFISIHRSYIINSRYVKVYKYEMVRMHNDDELCISKANRKAVRKEILHKHEKEIN